MWMIAVISVLWLVCFLTLAWKKPGWAMGLLVLTAGMPCVAGVIFAENEPHLPDGPLLIFTGLLLFLLTVILVYVKRQAEFDDEKWYKVVSGMIVKIILWTIYMAAAIASLSGFGAVVVIVTFIFVFRYKQTRRYSLALNVLSTLSAAIRQNLPLPMALETAAFGRKDMAARIFRAASKGLCEGRPLSESLKRAYRRCPAEIIAALAAAEAMNQLSEAIAAMEQDSVAAINGEGKIRPVHPVYPLVVIGMLFVIFMGLSIFIIPTFAEVIRDVTGGKEVLPAATRILIDISRAMARPSMAMSIGVGLLIAFLIGFYTFNRPRRPERPRFLSRWGDRIKWFTPGIRYFEKLRSQQRVIQSLRVGLKAGYSFDEIVRQVLRLDVNLCFQNRLRRWLSCIEAGQTIADSAAACGLGSTLAWALNEKVNKGNTPELLVMLEDIYRNRYHYRMNIAYSILCPFVIIGLGSGVGFVVYAMFIAMVSLITYTMQYSMP